MTRQRMLDLLAFPGLAVLLPAVFLLATAPAQAQTSVPVPAQTEAKLITAAKAKEIGLPEAVLVIRCGADWPVPAYVIQTSTTAGSFVRWIANCTTGYVTLPAHSEDTTLSVTVSPESQAFRPVITRY